ncbi:hypothetical protein [Megamonas funiformis]|jgi:hypothetical protein|uniref:hypothetical protein n=1 Tax=Megamonas funiformis TaxID=437897 RepID=UPI0025982411|nr:hypothetical protein [uncultured Megamonas sp.]
MHKKSIYLSKIFIIFILLFGLTVDISISEATSKNNKDSMMIKQEFICMMDQDYETLHSFVKQNIAQASPELAGQMVQNLILSSEKMLTPSADYIWQKLQRNSFNYISCYSQRYRKSCCNLWF